MRRVVEAAVITQIVRPESFANPENAETKKDLASKLLFIIISIEDAFTD